VIKARLINQICITSIVSATNWYLNIPCDGTYDLKTKPDLINPVGGGHDGRLHTPHFVGSSVD